MEPSTPSAEAQPRRGEHLPTEHGDVSPGAVVARFLEANRSLDVDAMFEEIAPEARWVFPAAPAGAPREVSGKEANRRFFESIRPMWQSFGLTFFEVHPLADDPDRVVAHYASTGMLTDGSLYANTYLSLVTVEAGRIVEWVEFCDPGPLERSVSVLRAGEQRSDVGAETPDK